MLREWTPSGYLTRDYCNFERQVVVARQAEAPAEEGRAEATPPAQPAPVPTIPAAAVAPQAAPRAAAKTGKKVQPRAEGAASGRLSINRASVAELAGLKGLSERLAEGIVAGRPWASVDEIVRVKGIGSKLLEKLRTSLEP